MMQIIKSNLYVWIFSYIFVKNRDYMIAEIRFKNMFSFRDEAILSFEADRSKDMESYHVVELGGD